jgi:hypothetical protein
MTSLAILICRKTVVRPLVLHSKHTAEYQGTAIFGVAAMLGRARNPERIAQLTD